MPSILQEFLTQPVTKGKPCAGYQGEGASHFLGEFPLKKHGPGRVSLERMERHGHGVLVSDRAPAKASAWRGWVGDGCFPKTLQLPAEGAGEQASPGKKGWRGWD